MAASEFVKSFLQGDPPKQIRMAVARGAAPVAPEEAIVLLAHLTEDPDREVAEQAAQTLGCWPEDDLLEIARAVDCPRDILVRLARSKSNGVLEAVILNAGTPGSAIEAMAGSVPAPLLEMILYNRVRLLESPGIITQAKSNPALTPEIRRIIQEVETEYFGQKKTDYSIGTVEQEGVDSATEFENLGTESAPGDLSLEGLPLDAEKREAALADRLARMTVPQRIRHAMMGNREARGILIRDNNRQVSQAVLQNPKLTESEIAAFAAMRNVTEEILREIGNSRILARSYLVVQNLVHNPKTPPSVSQRMVGRLHNRDLANVSRDKGLPEAVRRNAQRTLNQRLSH